MFRRNHLRPLSLESIESRICFDAAAGGEYFADQTAAPPDDQVVTADTVELDIVADEPRVDEGVIVNLEWIRLHPEDYPNGNS